MALRPILLQGANALLCIVVLYSGIGSIIHSSIIDLKQQANSGAETSPVSIDDVVFANPATAIAFHRELLQEQWFPLHSKFPIALNLGLLAVLGGLFGAMLRLAAERFGWVVGSTPNILIRGMVAGLMMYVFNYVYLVFMTSGSSTVPLTVRSILISGIVIGMFSEECRRYFTNKPVGLSNLFQGNSNPP